jgi:hypothetical protein
MGTASLDDLCRHCHEAPSMPNEELCEDCWSSAAERWSWRGKTPKTTDGHAIRGSIPKLKRKRRAPR